MTAASPSAEALRRRGVRARLSVDRQLALAVALALLLAVGAILAAILWRCDFHLLYTLDDPFISLSLGWHIAHGTYGINAGEAAAPASSVLYPLVLAAFGWASWQTGVPLVVNSVAAIGAGLCYAAALCRYGIVSRPRQVVRAAVLVVVLCAAVDVVGLVFTGLEHSLHLLTSVFAVLALARALEEDEVPPSLVVALVLLPLWRFEGAPLALLSIAALALAGRRRAAAVALAGVAATLGTYMAAMHAIGLPVLPSSVLSKSAIASDVVGRTSGAAAFAWQVAHNFAANLTLEARPLLLLLTLVAAHPLLRCWRAQAPAPHALSLRREFLFAGVVAGALAAQMLFGVVSLVRYAPYALASGAAAAIVLWRRPLAGLIARQNPVLDGLALAALLAAGAVYLVATVEAPRLARGIYEQQSQMRRFAVDYYRLPVAVTDLGWVSYRNPSYVLDLGGLGSEAARQARAGSEKWREWIARLVAAKRVGLVLSNGPDFVGQRPPGWILLAALQSPHYRPNPDTVFFLATSGDAVAPAVAALRAFARHLVPGTSLTIFDDPAGRRQ